MEFCKKSEIMKRVLTIIFALGLVPMLMSANEAGSTNHIALSEPTSIALWGESSSDTYDIIAIYEEVDVDYGSKALDNYGNLKEIDKVFIPAKIDTGRYEVELTRIDTNFYHICGTSYYIETRYCYEYASREEVLLNITSNYGYVRGEVIFF